MHSTSKDHNHPHIYVIAIIPNVIIQMTIGAYTKTDYIELSIIVSSYDDILVDKTVVTDFFGQWI